jgi:hypothetical protein
MGLYLHLVTVLLSEHVKKIFKTSRILKSLHESCVCWQLSLKCQVYQVASKRSLLTVWRIIGVCIVGSADLY